MEAIALSLAELAPAKVIHVRAYNLSCTWLANRIFEPAELPITIGRDGGNHISLPHDFISRRHARLEIDQADGSILLTDLDSRAGIYLPTDFKLVPGQPIRLPGSFHSFNIHQVHFSIWHEPREKLPADPRQLMTIPIGKGYNFYEDRFIELKP